MSKRRFGDRKDGYKVRDIHGVQNILIDFKPNRCDSAVYMNADVDVTNFCKFIDKLKKEGHEITYYHGMVMIMAKALYSRPYMNRFIANRTMYMHNNVSLAFTAKAQFEDNSIEFLTVQEIKETDTLFDISAELKKKVEKIRSNQVSDGANDAADTLGKLPKFLRVPVVGILKLMDKKGILPASIQEGNLYYSSAILSNIGTFKVDGIYHNLTNFGTASSLVTFGVIKEEGNKKILNMGITIDERIADGFYFCKALKLIEYMFANPEVMLDPAGQKVSIPKEEKK